MMMVMLIVMVVVMMMVMLTSILKTENRYWQDWSVGHLPSITKSSAAECQFFNLLLFSFMKMIHKGFYVLYSFTFPQKWHWDLGWQSLCDKIISSITSPNPTWLAFVPWLSVIDLIEPIWHLSINTNPCQMVMWQLK